MQYSRDDYTDAASIIQSATNMEPTIGLVLGSGLGGLADTLEDAVAVPYTDIPGWPESTVHGHTGRLVIGKLEGGTVIAQQGRAHFYEGYSMAQVTFPIRVMHYLGVKTVILTNAAGGLNPTYQAGDVMLLKDHINLLGMVGMNPLMGPNDDKLGPRFPGLVHTYDRSMREIAVEVAAENDITLHQGVYVALSGPFFETPAEVRMLRILGGDAVGMSTANEVLIARHAGMTVMACSGITNVAIDDESADVETNHEEVLEIGHVIVPRLTKILRGVLRRMA